jgi:protein-tyrosine phosphatase
VSGFVDLHCHWVARIDDGAPTEAEGIGMLRALRSAGFDTVIATPHMRVGMFDNQREDLLRAYERMQPELAGATGLPKVELSSEHYFDDVVYGRLLAGEALPYPGGRAALVEFYGIDFPAVVVERLFDLVRRGILPVIAHPERYRCIWRSPDVLERLIGSGVATLLDAAALVGKYGREPQRCAEILLERGLYHAACSDAHREADVTAVSRGMARIRSLYGDEEVDFLFRAGPTALLAGRLPE